MDTKSLYSFYENAVLPQFGISSNAAITWQDSRRIEGDEFAHTLQCQGQSYLLLFEDYAGAALSEAYVTDILLPPNTTFQFVEPTSQSNMPPSYDGFRLAVPSKYCENVTGVFTLLRLINSQS